MKTFIIINGKEVRTIKAETIEDARVKAINTCDHSKEIIVREINKTRREIKWVNSSDRHILIERDENNNIIGLNYMQGKQPPEFNQVDAKLSKFYKENHKMIKGNTEIEIVDNLIWVFFDATNN